MRTFQTFLAPLLVLLVCGAGRAQTAAPFAPIPADQQSAYRFQLSKTYFATPAVYRAAVKRLSVKVAQIQGFKGQVAASPQNLYQVLRLSDQFNVLFSRVYWYLDLQYSTNTKNTASRDTGRDLDTRLSPRLSFITDEIQKLTPAKVSAYIAAYPPLKVYKYLLTEALRDKPHTLSLREEQVLAAIQPLMTKWQSDQYELLMDRAPWGTVHDPELGDLDVRQDDNRIANSPARAVRQEGHDKTAAAYKAERDLFAFDLVNVAKAYNKIARLRHHKNGQAAAFYNLHLTYKDIDNVYRQILAHGALRKRLQTDQRQRIASFSGLDFVHSWDMTLVPPGVIKPRFTISEATDAIQASTAYLGTQWNTELDALLDPANGRLDIVPGANRVPNAFAIPSPGTRSVFYSYAYQGYLDDVTTLAHESGHVVHNGLMNAAHVPAALADGPRFFTESYAILDELVIVDSLYRKETDPGRKVYYLEHLLQQLMGFYSTARIAAIEKAAYEGVDAGTVQTADDLDKMTYKIGSQVSIWYDLEPDQNNLWEQIPHYYSSPTYYVNYVFADLLAQTYFAMYKRNPQGFAKHFTALERNGFNATPQVLLKKFLGISLSDPKTYNAVFAQQQEYLTELEQLYKQVDPNNPIIPGAVNR